MRLATLPLPKPYQQTDEYGRQIHFRQPQPSYIQPGDYVETPRGSGEVEETRHGKEYRLEFRIEGMRRWFDEKDFLNHLDHDGYLYSRRFDSI